MVKDTADTLRHAKKASRTPSIHQPPLKLFLQAS
jgi:hypothetical protein